MITIDNGTKKLLFALLRSAICGNQLQEKEKNLLTNKGPSNILSLSKNQDISHLIIYALSVNELLTSENKDIYDEVFKAVYRYEQLNDECSKLCDIFEKEQIPFIPLKGSVIHKYYPESWMRTSCDVDILVHKLDIKKLSKCLVDKYEYTRIAKSTHDISFSSKNKNHIELHFNLLEETLLNNASKVLESVWETAVLCKPYRCFFEMSDEMFYFYHIAHMAKHFKGGGCGIKPFIDLWLLDNVKSGDKNKRDELLEQGNMLKFAKVARRLCQVWLDDAEHTTETQQMEDYILQGGVYGTAKNKVLVQRQKKVGKFKSVFSRIFISFEELKMYYPFLEKYKFLTPIMQMRRWCRLLLHRQTKRIIKEIKINSSISTEDALRMKEFLTSIGL